MTDIARFEEQIEQIFTALRVQVFNYLFTVFGDPGEAEDLTQDAFLQLYRTRLKGQEIQNPRFWIFRIAHNLAANRGHAQFVCRIVNGSKSNPTIKKRQIFIAFNILFQNQYRVFPTVRRNQIAGFVCREISG